MVIEVLNNDIIPTGNAVNIVEINQLPANGIALIDNNGTIIYVPDPGFSGIDVFQYVICSQTACDTASVFVTIEDSIVVTNPVTAIADTATTTLGTSVSIPLLANDLGDDISITDVSNPLYGSFVVATDDSLIYTPNTNLLLMPPTNLLTPSVTQVASATAQPLPYL
ncbi:MAG: hypothetical protein IPN94_03070 [Sphingobacteriales bacterium]|nr:hypothetical protein [Sphingobacteriales bacterium]